MLIDSRPLWLAQTNCYVLAGEAGGPALVVDAPPDLSGVIDLLDRHSCVPVALLVTHGHVDHVGAAGGLVRRTGVTAYLHPDDDWLALAPLEQLRMLFGGVPIPAAAEFAPPDHYSPLVGGTRLTLAGLEVDVLHTPGHTPGHCCFYLPGEGVLFSGDQLFAGSIGRTDLPGGDYAQLMDSMEKHVLTLPDETDVLPGHGPATTIARERRLNPFLQDLPR